MAQKKNAMANSEKIGTVEKKGMKKEISMKEVKKEMPKKKQ